MKLVQLGDTDAAACVDGVCEVPQPSADQAGEGDKSVSSQLPLKPS